MIVRPNIEGDAWLALDLPWNAPRSLDALSPGSHVALISRVPTDGLMGRRWGLEVRDTLLVLSPLGASFVFLFRKEPEGTVAGNVLRYGVGALNIDGCRVAHASSKDFEQHKAGVEALKAKGGSMGNSWKNSSDLSGASDVTTKGRWPSNLVLVHAPGCSRQGTQTVKAPVINRFTDGMKPFGEGAGHPYESTGGGTEEVAVWACVEGCPVAELDGMSGILKSAIGNPSNQKTVSATVNFNGRAFSTPGVNQHGDSGGASRFFPQFESDPQFLEWLGKLLGIRP